MFYQIIDLLGITAFAISGVLSAMDKRLDLFGIFIIGFVTALGGGTLRDVLLGVTPVTWLTDIRYLLTVAISVVMALLLQRQLSYLRTSLFLFDTIGIGLYTVVGVEKGIAAGLHPVMCIAIGVITASFGGVIRDILCNEIPVIFHKEIYATACIAGGIAYFILQLFPFQGDVIFVVPILLIIGIRILAVRYHLTLPSPYRSKER